MEKEFDISQVKKVPISEIALNNWNPKIKRTPEFEKVKESIKTQGFLSPLIVREIEDDNFNYQILDGEQKLISALDLGIKDVPIYNLGKMSDDKAKQITIFMMQHVEADKEQLGQLLVELVGKVDLPYTDEEIKLMSGIDLVSEDDFEDEYEQKMESFSVHVLPDNKQLLKDDFKDLRERYSLSDNTIIMIAIKKLKILLQTDDSIDDLIKEEQEKEINFVQ